MYLTFCVLKSYLEPALIESGSDTEITSGKTDLQFVVYHFLLLEEPMIIRRGRQDNPGGRIRAKGSKENPPGQVKNSEAPKVTQADPGAPTGDARDPRGP